MKTVFFLEFQFVAKSAQLFVLEVNFSNGLLHVKVG